MGNSLGPKYIPYTDMGPLGFLSRSSSNNRDARSMYILWGHSPSQQLSSKGLRSYYPWWQLLLSEELNLYIKTRCFSKDVRGLSPKPVNPTPNQVIAPAPVLSLNGGLYRGATRCNVWGLGFREHNGIMAVLL